MKRKSNIQIKLLVNDEEVQGKDYKKYLNKKFTKVCWEIQEDGIIVKLYDLLKINNDKGYDRIENREGHSIGFNTMRNESYTKIITGKSKSVEGTQYIRDRYLLPEAEKQDGLNNVLDDMLDAIIELKKKLNKGGK